MSLTYSITYTNFDNTQVSGGSFSVNVNTFAPDITVIWYNPIYPTQTLAPYEYNYYVTGLTAGTYTLEIIDSSNSSTGVFNIFLSSGCCVSIINSEATTCGLNNGEIRAQISQGSGQQIFELYDLSNNLINTTGQINSNLAVFTNLPYGVYYVLGYDGYGGTGRSETCIVQDSSNLYFDLYVVNTSSCNDDIGKLYVVDLIGTNPFTYVWSNGVTGQDFITGLTAGSYSCTITDANGCSITKSKFVTSADTMGVVSIVTEQPSCFSSDGETTFTISGGTGPYYFSGSNGYTETSFLPSVTFTGLSSGFFQLLVTDAGWCTLNTSTTLFSPNSFSVNGILVANSQCSNTAGSITIYTIGSGYPLQYKLLNSSGQTLSINSSNSQTYIIQNLSSGIYNLEITDNGNVCTYTTSVEIQNDTVFEISLSQTGTTCGNNNGIVEVIVNETSSYPPYYYNIDSNGLDSIPIVGGTANTFTNLASGVYTVTVTNSQGCLQQSTINVDSSIGVDFILNPIYSPFPNSNYIEAYITQGTPPFNLYWSSNVNGQSGLTVTNLSAGTYSLTIVDGSGCTKVRTVTFSRSVIYSSVGSSIVCAADGFTNGTLVKRGILQMYLAGYNNLTQSASGCVFNSSTFTAEITVSGITYTNLFYTGTFLMDIPSEELWIETIESMLESIYGIGDVTYDIVGNTINIPTDCDLPGNLLAGADVEINLIINYNLSCVSGPDCCGIVTEDANVPPEGPNYCIITEDTNGNEILVIETD